MMGVNGLTIKGIGKGIGKGKGFCKKGGDLDE